MGKKAKKSKCYIKNKYSLRSKGKSAIIDDLNIDLLKKRSKSKKQKTTHKKQTKSNKKNKKKTNKPTPLKKENINETKNATTYIKLHDSKIKIFKENIQSFVDKVNKEVEESYKNHYSQNLREIDQNLVTNDEKIYIDIIRKRVIFPLEINGDKLSELREHTIILINKDYCVLYILKGNEKYYSFQLTSKSKELVVNKSYEEAMTYHQTKVKIKQNAGYHILSNESTSHINYNIAQISPLLSLLTNRNIIQNQMKILLYNDDRIPLGIIPKKHLSEAISILHDIFIHITMTRTQSDSLNKKNKDKMKIIPECSNSFYLLIPHRIPSYNYRKFLIDEYSKIYQKLILIQSLYDINWLYSKISSPLSIENFFNMRLKQIPLSNYTSILINQYLQSPGSIYEIIDLYEVFLEGDESDKYKTEDKLLLWKGVRIESAVSQLVNGITTTIKHFPKAEMIMGKGIWFTDCFDEAVKSCIITLRREAICFLCEVSIGKMCEKLIFDEHLAQISDSFMIIGRNAFNERKVVCDYSNCKVFIPYGEFIENYNQINKDNKYNQYVIYKDERVKIKYVLHVKEKLHNY